MVRQRETMELRYEVSELKHQVNELRAQLHSLKLELKESNKLLKIANKVPRPHTTSTHKQLIACRQGWKCATLGEDGPPCPMNGEVFDETLFVIDHIQPWSTSRKHLNNRRALCCWCDSYNLRQQVANGFQKDSDSEEDG